MAQVLKCPSCGASFDEIDPTKPTIECSYCGTVVALPESMRVRPKPPTQPSPQVPPVQQFQIAFQSVQVPRRRRGAGCFGLIAVLFSIGITVASVLLLTPEARDIPNMISTFVATLQGNANITIRSTSRAPIRVAPTSTVARPVTATPNAPRPALTFGGKGTGTGKFDDPRAIAVDNKGNIFVADYLSGRVQRFDKDGNFIQAYLNIPAPNKNMPIPCLGADTKGVLYVCRGGKIVKLNVESGEQVGTISDPEGRSIGSLVFMADGNIATLATSAARDDLVVFSPAGRALRRYTNVISTHTETAQTILNLAVDGLGHFYVLTQREMSVFHLGPEGKFVDRFGQKGDSANDFYGSVYAITADSAGRVIVSDWRYLHIFDSTGQRVNGIKIETGAGTVMGMAITTNDELYVTLNSGEVRKYALTDVPR